MGFVTIALLLVTCLVVFTTFAGRDASIITQLLVGSAIGAFAASLRILLPILLFDVLQLVQFSIDVRLYLAYFIECSSEVWYAACYFPSKYTVPLYPSLTKLW